MTIYELAATGSAPTANEALQRHSTSSSYRTEDCGPEFRRRRVDPQAWLGGAY